jgi:hypothetical protein
VLRPSGTVPRSCSPGSRWPAALDSVVERLRDRGVYAKQLRVGCASHAPHVEPIADDLRAALADLRPGTTRIPLYSTVFERELDGQELDGDYWVHNLRQPVRFAPAVRMALDQRPHTLFIEISTHSVLVPAMLAGVASIGQVALGRTVPGRTALIGLLLLLAGLALLLVTLATGSAFVFFVGTAVLGAGWGSTFLGAFRLLAMLADPARRGELMAAVYVVAYLAMSVPVVVAGLITSHLGLHRTATIFIIAVAVVCAVALGGLRWAKDQPVPPADR